MSKTDNNILQTETAVENKNGTLRFVNQFYTPFLRNCEFFDKFIIEIVVLYETIFYGLFCKTFYKYP